jgi:hypothetical protein
MFRPETYEAVKEHGVIGVRHEHRRRFSDLRAGDPFVAFISKLGLLDGHGRLASDPFEADSEIFGPDVSYPHRCKVSFDLTGAASPVGDLLWGLDQWERSGTQLRTHPANMLFCYGGFMEIPPSDFDVLVAEMGTSVDRQSS